jgi:hypothetical protein
MTASVKAEAAAVKSPTIVRKQLELGQASTLAVLTAQQTYLTAVLTRVQALASRYADTAATRISSPVGNKQIAARTGMPILPRLLCLVADTTSISAAQVSHHPGCAGRRRKRGDGHRTGHKNQGAVSRTLIFALHLDFCFTEAQATGSGSSRGQ